MRYSSSILRRHSLTIQVSQASQVPTRISHMRAGVCHMPTSPLLGAQHDWIKELACANPVWKPYASLLRLQPFRLARLPFARVCGSTIHSEVSHRSVDYSRSSLQLFFAKNYYTRNLLRQIRATLTAPMGYKLLRQDNDTWVEKNSQVQVTCKPEACVSQTNDADIPEFAADSTRLTNWKEA